MSQIDFARWGTPVMPAAQRFADTSAIFRYATRKDFGCQDGGARLLPGGRQAASTLIRVNC